MWEKVAKDLPMPWRAAEEMHWQLGKTELAQRAGVHPFSGMQEMSASSATAPGPGIALPTSFGVPLATLPPQSFGTSTLDSRRPPSISGIPTSLPMTTPILFSAQNPSSQTNFDLQHIPRGPVGIMPSPGPARRSMSSTTSPMMHARQSRRPSEYNSPRPRTVSEHGPMGSPGMLPVYSETSTSLPSLSHTLQYSTSPSDAQNVPRLPPVRFLAGADEHSPTENPAPTYEASSRSWPPAPRVRVVTPPTTNGSERAPGGSSHQA